MENSLINLELLKNEEILKEGEKIYNDNEFLRELYIMMNDSKFRIFVNKYLDNWTNIKNIILFIKLFECIENEYELLFNKKITKEVMLYSIKHLFNDKNLRKMVLKYYEDFQNYNYKYLLKKDNKKNKKNKKRRNKKSLILYNENE
jgi:hypothetical protein